MLENPAPPSLKFSSPMRNSSMEKSSHINPLNFSPLQSKKNPENVCTLPNNSSIGPNSYCDKDRKFKPRPLPSPILQSTVFLDASDATLRCRKVRYLRACIGPNSYCDKDRQFKPRPLPSPILQSTVF